MEDQRAEAIAYDEEMKKNHSTDWLQVHAPLLHHRILEYNEVAERAGADVIVAFTCTSEEREDFLNMIAGMEDADADDEDI